MASTLARVSLTLVRDPDGTLETLAGSSISCSAYIRPASLPNAARALRCDSCLIQPKIAGRVEHWMSCARVVGFGVVIAGLLVSIQLTGNDISCHGSELNVAGQITDSGADLGRIGIPANAVSAKCT